VVLMSRKNAWKQIFIFPVRYYANCVSTTVTVLITLKLSVSFIVTLYIVGHTVAPGISRMLVVISVVELLHFSHYVILL
jgi:hypothetical protein